MRDKKFKITASVGNINMLEKFKRFIITPTITYTKDQQGIEWDGYIEHTLFVEWIFWQAWITLSIKLKDDYEK